MQAQNTALLQQMTERDALNHALQSERLQLDQQAAALQEENRNCQNKVSCFRPPSAMYSRKLTGPQRLVGSSIFIVCLLPRAVRAG